MQPVPGTGNPRRGRPVSVNIETLFVKSRTRKLMIVCSEMSEDLETHLVCDGWVVTWIYDAQTAIAKVQREHFDVAVLISTGKAMDITETLFNLRDIRKSLPIVMVGRSPADMKTPGVEDFYGHCGTQVLSVQDVDALLMLLKSKEQAESSIGWH